VIDPISAISLASAAFTGVKKAAYKMYTWNETLYQSDNTKGWVLVG
jgi:hypothetical protein